MSIMTLPNGKKIAGSKLWYLDQPLTRPMAYGYNNFSRIHELINWAFSRGTESRNWLNNLPEQIALVATHVPTDARLVHSPDGLGRFYSHQISNWPAPVCISGHTHSKFNETLKVFPDERQFLSNPFGYTNGPVAKLFKNEFIRLC